MHTEQIHKAVVSYLYGANSGAIYTHNNKIRIAHEKNKPHAHPQARTHARAHTHTQTNTHTHTHTHTHDCRLSKYFLTNDNITYLYIPLLQNTTQSSCKLKSTYVWTVLNYKIALAKSLVERPSTDDGVLP